MKPVPGYSITTPYGKKGSAWGAGWHDGADYAAPAGTKVVAMWGGTVVEAAYPTSFGSAFGRAVVIDHDRLPDGSPGLWGLYAHLSKEVVSVGQRVEAGQKIGEVGTTGNSSGNHLHVGVYPEPRWSSGGGIDPDPWIDAEEDPFMGMTADDIGKAVAKHTWKDDIVPSPHGSDSDNPTWMAGSYLKEMYIRLRSIDERLERLEAERR